MGRYGIVILVLFSFMITLFSCGRSPQTIATVGKEKITITEFQDLLKQKKPRKQLSQISFEERKKVLMNHLEGRAKAMKAKELKLNEDPDLQVQLRRREERVLAAKYPEILIVEKFVTPEMIQAFSGIQTSKPRIITVALGYEGSKLIQFSRSREEAVTLADQIYQRIKEGEDIAELSAQYTDNPNLKKQKGLYDPYTAGALDPAVDVRVNQAEKSEIIAPIETDRGIFVIEILDKDDSARVALSENQRNRIRINIYNKFYRTQGDTIYKNLSEKFRSELGGEIFDDGIDEFLLAIEAWAATPNPTDPTFTETQKAIVLGRIADITISAGYFIDEFQGTFRTSYQRFNSHDELKKVLMDYIERYLAWITKAREAGIDRLPEVQKLLQQFLDSKLVELFDKNEIKEKAVPTEEEMRDLYEKNKKDFIDPEKIRIWEIALKDEKTAQTVLKKANIPGADFPALAREYTAKINLRDRGGDLGFQSIKSPRKIIKPAFEAGENQIIGPIKEHRFYYVIKTGDILPERQKDFKEVEIPVKSRTRNENEQKIREEWRNRLEKEYDIWIDEAKLKELS